MVLQFIKCCRMLIQFSSVRIKFQLLPLIFVVSTVEFSLATASYATNNSSSSASASSSSGTFLTIFLQSIPIFMEQKYIIFVFFFVFFVALILSFCRVDFVFIVLLILWIVVTCFCLCWTINYTVLVGLFNIPISFQYQQHKLRHIWIFYSYDLPVFWSQSHLLNT